MKCIIVCHGCEDDKGRSPKKSLSYCEECAVDQQDRHRRMGHDCHITIVRDDPPPSALYRQLERASRLIPPLW